MSRQAHVCCEVKCGTPHAISQSLAVDPWAAVLRLSEISKARDALKRLQAPAGNDHNYGGSRGVEPIGSYLELRFELHRDQAARTHPSAVPMP